jgi:hypothetical protein
MTVDYTDPYRTTHCPYAQPILAGQDSREVTLDEPDFDPRDVADSMRAACPCGWRGTVLAPVPVPDGTDLDAAAEEIWERDHLPTVQDPQPPAELTAALDTVRRLLREYATVEPLTATRLAGDLEHEAGSILKEAVSAARWRHATWESIGTTLGVTRQAAYQRFRSDLPAQTVHREAPVTSP